MSDNRTIPSRGRQRRGFTVIELLVVISLVTLLIAMLAPALGRAKESARSADCLAHLSQFGAALHMYVDDSRGKLPWAWSHEQDFNRFNDTTDPWHGYGGYTWAMLLYSYMGRNLEVYKCKSYASRNHPREPELGTLNGQEYLIFANYRPNPYFGGHGYGWGVAPNGAGPTNIDPRFGPRLADQDSPSDLVAVFDADRTWNPYVPSPAAANIYYTNAMATGDRTDYDNYSIWWMRPQLGAWHNRGSNIAFLDCHAEHLPVDHEKTFLDFEDRYWALTPSSH